MAKMMKGVPARCHLVNTRQGITAGEERGPSPGPSFGRDLLRKLGQFSISLRPDFGYKVR